VPYLSKFWIVPFRVFKVSGGEVCFPEMPTLNEAEIIAKKMNDEFVSIEHLIWLF
jgi:hypothetical protein